MAPLTFSSLPVSEAFSVTVCFRCLFSLVLAVNIVSRFRFIKGSSSRDEAMPGYEKVYSSTTSHLGCCNGRVAPFTSKCRIIYGETVSATKKKRSMAFFTGFRMELENEMTALL